MATIKSHTDLPQSKKLAEFLPLESADMYYADFLFDNKHNYFVHPLETYGFKTFEDTNKRKGQSLNFIPCWSLAALLNILPNSENISTNLSKGGYIISTIEYTNSWFVDYEDETNGLNNCVTSADNPIDACVEMILKLHELNLL